MLQQLDALISVDQDLGFAHDGLAALSRGAGQTVVAGFGNYDAYRGRPLDHALTPDQSASVSMALNDKRSVSADSHYVAYVEGDEGQQNILLLDGTEGELPSTDDELVTLFCCNVGIALDNLLLRDEIEKTQRDIIYRLGEVVETRSKETGNHVRRVAEYSYLLARKIGLPDDEAEMIRLASPLHDIGKIGIPDSVLLKPGSFSDDERKVMQTHAAIGFEMLRSADSRTLRAAAVIAQQHHEKFDGSGYPQGLSGDGIHLYGRIAALADVFDALGSTRVYKPAWPIEKVRAVIREERGKHFDPVLVDLFFEHFDAFNEIRQRYAD